MVAAGVAVLVALAFVILVAVSSGSRNDRPKSTSHSSTTQMSASLICSNNAKVWVAKALNDLTTGVDPSQDLIRAATIYGTESQTYQAIVDAFSRVSTVVYQQGVMTAAKQAGGIVDDDCSDPGSSSGDSSKAGGASRISASAPTTTQPASVTTSTLPTQTDSAAEMAIYQGSPPVYVKDLAPATIESAVAVTFAQGLLPMYSDSRHTYPNGGQYAFSGSTQDGPVEVPGVTVQCGTHDSQVTVNTQFGCSLSGPAFAPSGVNGSLYAIVTDSNHVKFSQLSIMAMCSWFTQAQQNLPYAQCG